MITEHVCLLRVHRPIDDPAAEPTLRGHGAAETCAIGACLLGDGRRPDEHVSPNELREARHPDDQDRRVSPGTPRLGVSRAHCSRGPSCVGPGDDGGVGQPRTGATDAGFEVAPDFPLATVEGGTFALSDRNDGPVLLYFWMVLVL